MPDHVGLTNGVHTPGPFPSLAGARRPEERHFGYGRHHDRRRWASDAVSDAEQWNVRNGMRRRGGSRAQRMGEQTPASALPGSPRLLDNPR
jgi:hypothetical protein